MSQGACSNYCKTSQYMYAVVEGGTACYCSNQQPPDANRVEDSKCDKPCAGYPFEMCGSVPDSAGSSGVGAGAYANVMLVGNSLVAENAPAPPPPPPVPVPPPASIPADSSTSVESEKKPTPAAATAAAAKGSLHPEARNDSKSAKSKVNDEENTDEGGNDEEDNNDDESTEGDDDSGDQAGGDGEGEDEDGDDEDGKDESQLGNSGKALSGHGKKSSASNGSKIPVASISVAVACLFGICAFLIYLTKKRKRERVRAAWVESVFGANGSSTQGGPSPGPYNNSTMNSAMTERMMSAASHPGGAGGGRGAGYHQRNLYDDRNSMMSDSPDRDRMIDRRQSTASTVAGVAATPMSAGGGGIGTRRESAMSRNIHNTVMLPSPAVRGSYGTTAVTPSWGGGGYSSHRNPEPHHSDGYQNHHHNERYSEFYDQDDCGAEAAEAAHLVIDYSPGPTGVVSATPPPRVQRPAVVVYSKGNKGVRTSVHPHQPGGSPFDLSGTVSSGSNGAVGGNEYYEEDPFKDRRDHLYQQHQQQRHSMHTSLGGGVGGHRSSGVSDYRRPHSYSAAGQRVGARGDTDVEPKTLNYRTHVLDESSDLESIADGEVAAVVAAGTGCQMQSNSSTIGKLSGNLLKDHFKRLSTPYVKAIRDQQQHQATSPTSLSCVEEGGGGRGRGEGNLQQKGAGGRDVDSSMAGGGNGFESSMPVPGPAPPSSSDRRWSRALLKGHRQQQSSSSEEVVEELSGDEVGTMQDHYRRGHRQVHSGSLASFRGLDDPSHPRLRVMNPDDGTSPNFAFTTQTPLGNLSDPREYADGALATQKLIADVLIPLDRQLWTGIDTRTAYFKNDFGAEKISKVPELLQAGMRRLVLDLWWDSAALGWQLCPRLKRDTNQLGGLRLALEQEQDRIRAAGSSSAGDDALLQLQGMGNIAPVAIEATAEELKQETQRQQEQEEQDHDEEEHASITSIVKRERSMEEGPDNSLSTERKRASPKKITGNSPTLASGDNARSNATPNHSDRITNTNRNKQEATTVKSKDKNRSSSSSGREWFRKKKRPVRPAIKTHRHKQPTASEAEPNKGFSRYAASQHPRGRVPHRLAINKGFVASYNAALAADQTLDGITCSSGEDLTMLLQALLGWTQQTTDPELGDVILIILNLNELNNNSLGSRPTSPTPVTPVPVAPVAPVAPTAPAAPGTTPPVTPPPITNAEFFGQIISPNTNRTINDAATNMVSLKKLFMDAFPSMIYSPNLLELERSNLEDSWWRDGAVGLDYYNTTKDPITNRTRAPTGWPTSHYLRNVITRRIVVGIGANNLAANTTYNITDDYTTFHPPGVMGPSMTNSSLLRVSSTLNQDTCSLPVPGVMMYPTGSEENFVDLANLRRNSGPITSDVTWSFASMSDNDMSPWTYLSGGLATSCGFSSLVEGRSQSLSFSEQTAMTIWSWDLNQPPEEMMRDRNHRCGAMKSNGRWVVQDCNDKLPVACRKVGTSSQWIIYEKGSGNYRDVTCPEGYKFDVPRTSRENQLLLSTLQAFWNTTTPTFFQSLSAPEPGASGASLKTVLSRLTDTVASAIRHHKRRDERAGRIWPRHTKEDEDDDDDNNDNDDDDGDDDGDDDDEQGTRSNNGRKGQSVSHEQERQRQDSVNNPGSGIKEAKAERPKSTPGANAAATDALSGGGVIWIDISSWQTAGCWVPGGVEGRCPYREPDNTVALQEIIKVSTIGGVIILILVGIFLYMKCRRNVRLRKASKRRADVRTKILLTEVETVPA
ncbi:hypothetical protein EC991_002240 [Linnemannia zychae]|nr:hypothetical protein EC991_002240 [Linnemannia zychae]